MYQQTRLSDTSAIGAPGPLPDVIATWGDAPDLLADLTGHVDPQFGLDGTGFWPVDVTPPAFESSTQVLVQPTTCESVDTASRRWTATATVRDMTDVEFLLANPVPDNVTNYQARAVLIEQGYFSRVETALRGADQTVVANQIALQAWDYANVFERDEALIGAMQAVLGLTDKQVDAMFRLASAVP